MITIPKPKRVEFLKKLSQRLNDSGMTLASDDGTNDPAVFSIRCFNSDGFNVSLESEDDLASIGLYWDLTIHLVTEGPELDVECIRLIISELAAEYKPKPCIAETDRFAFMRRLAYHLPSLPFTDNVCWRTSLVYDWGFSLQRQSTLDTLTFYKFDWSLGYEGKAEQPYLAAVEKVVTAAAEGFTHNKDPK